MVTVATSLMDDPAYVETFDQTMDMLRRAEMATEEALIEQRQTLEQAQEEMDAIKAGANRLPDGTLIFRDEEGRVYTEDGELVTDELMLESVVWKDGAATQEEYTAQQQLISETRQHIEQLQDYQVNVLGDVREEMSDEQDLPSREELEELQEDILEQAPPSIASELEVTTQAPDMNHHAQTFEHAVPKL